MAGPYIATTSPSVVSPGSMLSTNRERSANVQTGEFSAVNQAGGSRYGELTQAESSIAGATRTANRYRKAMVDPLP